MESKLDRARREIRQVDEEMLRLFERRMEAVRRVAAEKERLGLPVEDPAQEARVLAELAPKLEPGPLRAFYVQFQQDVMDVSKRWQEFLREQGGDVSITKAPSLYAGWSFSFERRKSTPHAEGALLVVLRPSRGPIV